MNKIFKVIFTGGGSGGHTMPAFSMIQSLKDYCQKTNIDLEILYIGSYKGIEKTIAEKNNIKYLGINTGKLRRYLSIKNIMDIFNIIIGLMQSKKNIKKIKPDVLVSTGGFVSIPPVISAKWLKIPVIIHEQTIDAGLANKIASKFADKIAVTFEESCKYFPIKKTIVTGIPLRKEIFSGNKENAIKRFGFDLNLPVLYFTGGGLGCHILNKIAIEILSSLLDKCNIIFQTGGQDNNNDFKIINEFRNTLDDKKKKRFIVYNFIHDELPDIFAITNLAIARSGAGTVNEFMALNVPAIFVPLPIATNNEQLKNAKVLEKIGGAVIIEEKQITSQLLLSTIQEILFTDKIIKMKNNIKKSDYKDGTENMMNLILNYIK